MNNILVTTDFSAAANTAIDYAAHFAKQTNRKLTIANFKISPPLAEPVVCRYIREAPEILEEMSETIQKNYAIACNYIAERTDKSLPKIMENLSSETDLIIMGTNGVDDLYQLFFGTNTYQVIKRSKCPVLIIPEGVIYQPIERIVFAWDYTRENNIAFSQLNTLLKNNPTEITFLHISQQETAVSDSVFQALKESVSSRVPENKMLKFVRLFSGETAHYPEKILEYTENINANLLVTTYYERGIQTIFHGAMTRKLSEQISCPLLVLHV